MENPIRSEILNAGILFFVVRGDRYDRKGEPIVNKECNGEKLP